MKAKQFLGSLLLFSLLVIQNLSCKKDDINTPPTITIEKATEVTETSFVINWATTATDIDKITIKLSLDGDMKNIEDDVHVTDLAKTSHLFEGLKGATDYYLKIKMELAGGTTLESSIKKVGTSYQDESVTMTTSDGLSLAGRIKYLGSDSSKRPAIIFMHQYKCLGNYWNGSDLERKCVARGWVCMVLDFRGHFGSDSWPLPDFFSMQEIKDIQTILGLDVTAAVNFMKSNPKVDADKLALLGASLGANMSLEGNCQVLTSVAFASSLWIPNSLCTGVPLKSVFYIVGEFDITQSPGPNFCEDTKVHYSNTQDPKKLLIMPVKDHGWNVITPAIEDEVVDWLETRFTE